MTETKRLGRGLEALLGPMSREQAEATGALRDIAVGAIAPNPFQPRRSFDDSALAELAASIASSGLLQPITVRAVGSRFELIEGAGHHPEIEQPEVFAERVSRFLEE